MQKTWNITLYRDGKPVAHKRGVSHTDAVAQIYRLSRTAISVEQIADELPEAELVEAT